MKKIIISVLFCLLGGQTLCLAQSPDSQFGLLRQQAAAGDPVAQTELGCRYFWGDEVPRNDLIAIKWFRDAAEAGSAEAQCMLGFCYYFGRGIESPDIEQAVEWWIRASEQGFADAREALVMLARR